MWGLKDIPRGVLRYAEQCNTLDLSLANLTLVQCVSVGRRETPNLPSGLPLTFCLFLVQGGRDEGERREEGREPATKLNVQSPSTRRPVDSCASYLLQLPSLMLLSLPACSSSLLSLNRYELHPCASVHWQRHLRGIYNTTDHQPNPLSGLSKIRPCL